MNRTAGNLLTCVLLTGGCAAGGGAPPGLPVAPSPGVYDFQALIQPMNEIGVNENDPAFGTQVSGVMRIAENGVAIESNLGTCAYEGTLEPGELEIPCRELHFRLFATTDGLFGTVRGPVREVSRTRGNCRRQDNNMCLEWNWHESVRVARRSADLEITARR